MTDKDNIEIDSPEEEIQEASVEEAVDPKDAEAASVAAADKAADAGKTAPARKMAGGTAADNTTKDPAPKTKAGMINAMFSKMNNMSKKQLADMYGNYSESTEIDETGLLCSGGKVLHVTASRNHLLERTKTHPVCSFRREWCGCDVDTV